MSTGKGTEKSSEIFSVGLNGLSLAREGEGFVFLLVSLPLVPWLSAVSVFVIPAPVISVFFVGSAEPSGCA